MLFFSFNENIIDIIPIELYGYFFVLFIFKSGFVIDWVSIDSLKSSLLLSISSSCSWIKLIFSSFIPLYLYSMDSKYLLFLDLPYYFLIIHEPFLYLVQVPFFIFIFTTFFTIFIIILYLKDFL